MKKPSSPVRAIAAAVVLAPALSEATVLSHDSFTGYSAGELPTQNPAVTGYTGAWTDVAFGDAEPSITIGSLIYGDSLYAGSSGDKVSKGPDAAGIAAGNSGRSERLLDSSLVVTNATAGTVYVSWLFQTGNQNTATQPAIYQTFGLWNGTGGTDANRDFEAGIASGDFGGTNYAFRLNNSGSFVGNLGVAADSNVHLFVARFVLGATAGSDSVTVWLDPTLGGGTPTGGVTFSGTDIAFDRLVFSDYASNSSAWDEVRWGTDFDSVTVPEPASALMGAFGLIALLRRRRL